MHDYLFIFGTREVALSQIRSRNASCMYIYELQVGEKSCGKSSVVRTLAQLTGHKLIEFPINSDTDTTEIVGSFQQVCSCLPISCG